jgi:hypothetical protein
LFKIVLLTGFVFFPQHSDVTREVAEEMLFGTPPGTFLVRKSAAKPGAYSLTLTMPNGSIRHDHVLPAGPGVFR